MNLPLRPSASGPLLVALVLGGALGCAEQESPSAAASQLAPENADLILHGGVLWTVDPQRPTVEALAVRGDRIAALGSEEEVMSLRGPSTEVVDLDGAFALPGFIDTHVHFASAARFLEFNIMAVATQAEFESRLQAVVEDLPEGEWVLGGYWGAYDEWAVGSAGGEAREPFTPDLGAVESFTAAHPVFLQKFDRSQFAANRAALEQVGLDPDAPAIDGIEFATDEAARPTGIMTGRRAARLFAEAAGEFGKARRLRQTRHALGEIARHGVTTVSDMSDDLQVELYQELHAAGELSVRVHYRYPLERWPELKAEGVKVGSGDEWIRFGALKGHIDGIMGTSTARFFDAYDSDPSNRGRWRKLMVDAEGVFVDGQFLEHMLGADAAGLQLSIHAIGDEANHLLLNYLDEVVARNGARDRRFRLVHAQVMREEDMARLGPLGVLAEVQPFHLSDDMRWMEERIGAERCRGAYAFRSIADHGGRLVFGTDWPGTSAAEYPIDPLLALFAATTRQTVKGEPEGGWFPEQVLGIEEAIAASTRDAAYASYEEDLKGQLKEGMLADLAVFSHDLVRVPPEQLLEARCLMTLVGGRIVHRDPQFDATASPR